MNLQKKTWTEGLTLRCVEKDCLTLYARPHDWVVLGQALARTSFRVDTQAAPRASMSAEFAGGILNSPCMHPLQTSWDAENLSKRPSILQSCSCCRRIRT